MKLFKAPKFTTPFLIILFAFSLSNCSVRVETNRTTVKMKQMPPGQAKKLAGQRNAKRYAPGQNR